MFTNTKLAKAVKLACMFGAASSVGFTGLASAQEDGASEDIEKIQVTGSRIKRVDIESSSPVLEISAADIKSTGFTRIEDVLNQLPQIEAAETSFLANGATGTASIDLRGLGANRTLVLVNGRRLQPGGVYSQAPDVNQIPAALVERVDVLTGGGATAYGADAVAGVVNFVMNDDFEGVQINVGAAGYQHDNRNSYIQGLMDDRNFEYPEGSNGIGGESYNIDLTIGGSFAENKGHAVVYGVWRRNNEMLQGERDYGSCALNAAGTSCGGSSTAPIPNFFLYPIVDGETDYGTELFWSLTEDNTFVPDDGTNRYNFNPINHFMRPNERFSIGSFVDYELSDTTRLYFESSFMQDRTAGQIAESGTFYGAEYTFDYNNPLLSDAQKAQIQTAFGQGADDQFAIYIGKRNVEGGPRQDNLEHNAFRIVTGVEGEINDEWEYDVNYQYGSTSSSSAYINDLFLPSIEPRVGAVGTECEGDCLLYNVFVAGGVTAEQAAQLSGTAILTGVTTQEVYSAYVSGDTLFTLPGADYSISAAFGVERREIEFERIADTVYQEGQLVGQGGPTQSLVGGYSVNDVFGELSIPLVSDIAIAEQILLDVGFRSSNYSTSGSEFTYKIATEWDVNSEWKLRASFNRAIRAPNIGELFAGQSIGLWGGVDNCATETPEFSQAQCANTGLTAAQYGNISASPADQYNQFSGGNPDLLPEEADTFSLGVVANPFENFNFSLDYWDIEMESVIGTVGAERILTICAETGDPAFCENVNRNAAGSLWIGNSGFVTNLSDNVGGRKWRGVDAEANYLMELGDGNLSLSLVGSYNLEKTIKPLSSDPSLDYDCSGLVSTDCFAQPKWRHTLSANYSTDMFSVVARWRYLGQVDYEDTTDTILIADGGIKAFSFVDLAGSYFLSDNVTINAGVNNILDKAPPLVGGSLSTNSNTVAGFYDTLGRYMFTSVTLTF